MQSLPGAGCREGELDSLVGLLYWSLKPVHEMIWNFLLSLNLSHDRNNRDYDYTFQRQVMRGIALDVQIHMKCLLHTPLVLF